eukprot:gene23651-1474_t
MVMADHYCLLGIHREAKKEDIKKAFKKKALELHPDKNPEGECLFKQVSNAYQVLVSPSKKHKYDRDLSRDEARSKPNPYSFRPEPTSRPAPFPTGPGFFHQGPPPGPSDAFPRRRPTNSKLDDQRENEKKERSDQERRQQRPARKHQEPEKEVATNTCPALPLDAQAHTKHMPYSRGVPQR